MSAPAYEILGFDDIECGARHVLTRTIGVEDVERFGHLSGDLNPLHMEDAFAARTVFGRRVVHGLFTGALVSTAHTRLTGPGFVYVGQELRFLGPVFIDDTLTVEVTVNEKKAEKRILVMHTEVRKQDGQVIMQGRSALKELTFV